MNWLNTVIDNTRLEIESQTKALRGSMATYDFRQLFWLSFEIESILFNLNTFKNKLEKLQLKNQSTTKRKIRKGGEQGITLKTEPDPPWPSLLEWWK